MRIEFHTNNAQITQRFREYVEPRLESLQRHSNRQMEARVGLSEQRGRFRVEITITINGTILRGEEYDRDPLTSFDQALDKVHRQLERFKSRFERTGRRAAKAVAEAEGQAAEDQQASAEESDDTLEIDDIKIVRTKTHILKPMTPEEAALQMELVGHDFFVFFNGNTERVGVVYRRKDGDYGLIEPEIG